MKAWGFRTGALGLGVVVTLLLVELGFRVAGSFAPFGRADRLAGGASLIVLCVGDSHTWGSGRGYPARLSAALEERDGRVVNLGIPGTNTAQLRHRVSKWIDRYDPDVLVIWTGLNNYWNRSEAAQGPGWVQRVVDRSRVVRLVRAWRMQRELDPTGDSYVVVARNKAPRQWRLDLPGDDEQLVMNVKGDEDREDEMVAISVEHDLRAVVGEARERGVEVVAVTYPQVSRRYLSANEGIRAALAGTGAALVEGGDAVRRLTRRVGWSVPKLDSTAHPTQILYDEIGDLIAEAIDLRLRARNR